MRLSLSRSNPPPQKKEYFISEIGGQWLWLSW